MIEKLEKEIMKLRKYVDVVGYSGKIRDNKVRVYIRSPPAFDVKSMLPRTLTVDGVTYEIEYVVIGDLRAL